MAKSFVPLVVLPAIAMAASVERVSVSTSGVEGNGPSFSSAVSADGRIVAFVSLASNLIPNDSNATRDIFVRDRLLMTTERVSVSSDGAQANDESWQPSVSADGRYVAFASKATNLIPGDTNTTWDVFVRDRQANTTERVSVSSSGQQTDNFSFQPTLSYDGRYVCFMSLATNLVPGDTNGVKDIFVRDRLNGTTERVSVGSAGEQANLQTTIGVMSADGQTVAMISYATNLGPGDTNGVADAFVHSRITGATLRVGAGNGPAQDVAIDATGRYVAFDSQASDIVGDDTNERSDVFVFDKASGAMSRASLSSVGLQLSGGSNSPSLSADGRFVGFWSDAANGVPGDANSAIDVFVRDRMSSGTGCPSGCMAGMSLEPALSASGSVVAFQSEADNLVVDDTNGVSDIFVWDSSESVMISGRVVFGTTTFPASVEFAVGWEGWPVPFLSTPASLGPTGEYSVDVPRGYVRLSTKPSHWLRRTQSVDASEGSISEADVLLINGDAEQDNVVNVFDLNQAFSQFGAQGSADVDESGLVDIFDLNIMFSNFGVSGDQ